MKNIYYKIKKANILFSILFFSINPLIANILDTESQKSFLVDENSSYYIKNDTWAIPPSAGDTIFISSARTKPLRFQNINGSKNSPVVIINYEGQVVIDGPETWGAITFENCTNIKVSGNGHSGFKYGFKLAAKTCGLAFSELSSDCEAEFIKIDHEGFFGIYAKKDYNGNPPSPAPVFSNLIIHDCFIQNVTEGMYLGETKSPGMEFKHVKIYNNIVKNTGRESIQIANMVEDIEIFNNTLLNAGIDNELYQSNILQIGDNSVAKVYNNIIIGAPSFGIISLGMGNNTYTNNFISSCKGIFSDNRLFTTIGLPIKISGNYFTNIIGSEIIKNMNEINTIEITENEWDTDILFYKNASGNDNNYILENNQYKAVIPIIFMNPEENDYSLLEGTPEKYLTIGAPGGPDYFETVNPEPEPSVESFQLILTSDMLFDELAVGSYWSAEYLIDEQTCTPENNTHPLSQSWKPYWNMNLGPYHIYIDLKEIHHVTNISIHDMHNTKNLDVSVGEPGNWQPLFTEPLDKYKTWKEHSTNVETRYIRLSMNESVYAAINELVVYGYPLSGNVIEKSLILESAITTSANGIELMKPQIQLVQNPIVNNLIISIPEGLRENFTIEVFNINGNRLLSEIFPRHFAIDLDIDLSSLNISNGIYLLKYTNKTGFCSTLKFRKNNF